MNENSKPFKKRNYKPWIIAISIILIGAVGVLAGLPGSEDFDAFDLTILPLLNAIFNSFTLVFLIGALVAILNKKYKVHSRFIYAAFVSTFLFLLSYVTYHALAPSTTFGGEGFIAGFYYFILITHIFLAASIVPLALTSVARAWNREYERHKKIVHWTMPIWLYVSVTGVLVYILIAPYY